MLFVLAMAICASITVGLLVFSLSPQKSRLAEQLEAMQARNISGPSRERFAAMERIFGDEKGLSQLQQQLTEAGWYSTTPAQIGARVGAGLIGGVALGAIPLVFLRPFSMLYLLIPVLLAMLAAYAPFFTLNRAIAERKKLVQKVLPDFLDMLATTVQAGVALNQAMSYALPVAPGPLGDEVKECLSQVRLGRSLSDGLKSMSKRINQPQLVSTVTAITQAEKIGANISQVLHEVSIDIRNQRIMFVEEKAATLPITMVFPMALFLLPALFCIIFGSVAAEMVPQYVPWLR